MSMWETIPVAVKAVEKFFDWRSKRERQFVSTGLAVGYYYNFLHPFCSAFVGDDFTLYSQIKDSKPLRFRSQGKFKLADARVQIIIPSRLDDASFKRCEDELESFRKGFFYSPQNRRHYGMNYSVRKLGARTELTIVDLARPVMCVEWFYKYSGKLDSRKELNKWQEIQTAEIAVFKETVGRLLTDNQSVLLKKLQFRGPP